MLSYTYSKRHNRLQYTPKKSGLRSLFIIGAFLTIATILIQLYTMSIFATQGDEVAKLENRKEALVRENKILRDDIARAQNLDQIKDKSDELGYVDIDYSNVNYLVID